MAGWSEEATSEGSPRGGVFCPSPCPSADLFALYLLSIGSTSPPDPALLGAGTSFSSFLGPHAALRPVFGTQSVVNKGLSTHRRTFR